MTIKELHKIIIKDKRECNKLELYLKAKWKKNDSKAIFETTGLDIYSILPKKAEVIIKNPYKKQIETCYNSLNEKENDLTLILDIKKWKYKTIKTIGYDFTNEEIDNAINNNGYIGIKMNIKCYITPKLIENDK